MKSHTPLDGIPDDPRVTYVVVGRDPRDASVSKDHHRADMAATLDERLRGDYADLQADLPGELARLADALGIELSPARAAELSQHATLTAMRSRASDYAPESDWSLWKDATSFFRSGASGEWRQWVDDDFERQYAARVAELTEGDEELARWMHEGSYATPPS